MDRRRIAIEGVPPAAGRGGRSGPGRGKGVNPKLKKAVFKGRLLSGGAADLLLSPCPIITVSADEPTDEDVLAVPPGISDDFAARRERVKASVEFPQHLHFNLDSQVEQMLKVQKDFIEANPKVGAEYQHLRNEPVKSQEKMDEGDFAKMEDGTFSLCFGNNQRVIFSKPKVMVLDLKEAGIKNFFKAKPTTPAAAEVDPSMCPPPSPYDAMQAKLRYEYAEKVDTQSVVARRMQCGTGGVEQGEKNQGEMEMETDENLNIYADQDAEDMFPD